MSEELPKYFDIVVIGTGVTESIVSAAASRNGHSVLHLDPREYYGSACATLNFDSWSLQEFAVVPPVVVSQATDIPFTWRNSCHQVQQVWYDQSKNIKAEFEKNKRRFNIDVFPHVIQAREEMIELLIKSDVSRYLEFLRVGKLLTSLPPPDEDTIVSIPLSRADIFASKSVGLVEKRCLVKFIEAVMQQGSEEQNSNLEDDDVRASPKACEAGMPFLTLEEMAKIYKLSPKVKHMIKSGIETIDDALLDNNLDVDFVLRCKKFLQSIGRFGNQTPYLWPLYGIGEICQAFCRLSAVYGTIFILKRFISSIEVTTDQQLKIKSENDEFTTKHLVVGPELHSIESPVDNNYQTKVVGRGVIITTGGSLKIEGSEGALAKGDGICVYKIGGLQVIEMNHLSQAVPKNFRLLQATFVPKERQTPQKDSPRHYIESLLQPFLDFDVVSEAEKVEDVADSQNKIKATVTEESAIGASKPKAIYGSYFWLDLFEDNTDNSNIHNCAVNSASITRQIERAQNIFNKIFPGEEFLPKPPNADQEEEEDNAELISGDVVSEPELLNQVPTTRIPEPELNTEQ